MGSQMKAAVFYGPRDVRVETVPRPSAGPGEVILRVLRCAVCGTDKRIFTHGQKNVVPPAITGHEIVGTVEEIGGGVDGAGASNTIFVIPSPPSGTTMRGDSRSTSGSRRRP
ncbi:MAG: alcohol dehydrogenase catalytic domain-containing protein [Acidobacteriia bacterium]|nr:alcohol dehydrogenase catalytic domain-containing protein [Terriglobia bacterium]